MIGECCFIIVKDMLLTGFDAPICQVMYLDRKIIDHGLLQAIARVNRTKKGKQRGYVVDYYRFKTEGIYCQERSLKNDINF